LGKAVESTLENIALGIAFHTTTNLPQFAFCGYTVEFIVIAEEIVGVSEHIPNPLNWRVYIPFNHFAEQKFGILRRKIFICYGR